MKARVSKQQQELLSLLELTGVVLASDIPKPHARRRAQSMERQGLVNVEYDSGGKLLCITQPGYDASHLFASEFELRTWGDLPESTIADDVLRILQDYQGCVNGDHMNGGAVKATIQTLADCYEDNMWLASLNKYERINFDAALKELASLGLVTFDAQGGAELTKRGVVDPGPAPLN